MFVRLLVVAIELYEPRRQHLEVCFVYLLVKLKRKIFQTIDGLSYIFAYNMVLFNTWCYLLWETEEEQRTFINLLSKISVGRGGVGAGVGAGSVVLSSSRPAPYVPEDLVAQAQSVLQGILGCSIFGTISLR